MSKRSEDPLVAEIRITGSDVAHCEENDPACPSVKGATVIEAGILAQHGCYNGYRCSKSPTSERRLRKRKADAILGHWGKEFCRNDGACSYGLAQT